MTHEELVNRINELARKAKTAGGLTDAEVEERNRLRRRYIDAFRTSLRNQLDNIRFTDEVKQPIQH
ncbi:DUF896 domain-containing protein [Paenibacillus thermoaerophilus]|uniref:UPF0291 protein ACFQWB_12840 n=1 Tax=Paenibacillus thermoaerophilus TaxID=1215385 RepID=A0ABW2V3S5_9BACL|nr:DUF896 domain-containing protein [Paenibacillus thermoaerophilus]TMV17125.1 DUF896 domain-containing protein [Paenibacillus thermoaerophilus]